MNGLGETGAAEFMPNRIILITLVARQHGAVQHLLQCIK
jgi:hypothetical protein